MEVERESSMNQLFLRGDRDTNFKMITLAHLDTHRPFETSRIPRHGFGETVAKTEKSLQHNGMSDSYFKWLKLNASAGYLILSSSGYPSPSASYLPLLSVSSSRIHPQSKESSPHQPGPPRPTYIHRTFCLGRLRRLDTLSHAHLALNHADIFQQWLCIWWSVSSFDINCYLVK